MQQPVQSLKRNLSYNDLKKRRLIRSMTNKGKLQAIQNQHKQNSKQNNKINNIQSEHTSKNFHKLDHINNHIKNKYADKQNDFAKQLNILHYTDGFANKSDEKREEKLNMIKNRFQINQNLQSIKNNSLGFKKVPSMRILTKKSSISHGMTRLNNNILKRIEGNQFLQKQKQKKPIKTLKEQNIIKYNSVPQQNIPPHNLSLSNKVINQNIFFNTLSPISKKNDKNLPKQIEISGFSLLLGIQQVNQDSQYQKDQYQQKTNQNKAYLNTDFQIHLPQIDAKMPRIMKKHLPKDFFLRV